ncbi:ABC transporter ATP-binding protein [Streptococcus gallinaceus]|uniref:ABC transport system ATP-binding protein n=1 Tax=Streptococcus gallinaceus TaxID=165758 RepID=A0ABV2JKR7_9STRE|nr:ABC transporter ATP-binding protein [Streptococcus gallinaceus]MCP1638328.1 putative ABC transport system ATP-binding protein [Streptococcus gallinaceus]MCP1769585.1 putative ABC transport system ATP-binding protein [Streptococcus gallinaceus]
MENVMELKGISKYYLDGEEQAVILDELDLTVQAGEFVAILGPSGSGKSTLLSIAGLLLSADGGHLLLDGQDVTKLSQKEQTKLRRHKLGFIFQSHQLLPYLTVQDQLEQVARFDRDSEKDKSRAEISQLLGELGMGGSAHKFPRQLSGGQKQRAAIARAFIHQPKLILADEPTASLDEARGRQVTELIRKEVTERKTAAIMVTHDERILDLVDTVYRLKHGKLVKES